MKRPSEIEWPVAAGMLLGCVLLSGGCGRGGAGGSSARAASGTSSVEGPGRPAGIAPENSPVRFEEQSRERGIDFNQDNGASDDKFFVEVLGSGAIFFDADGDGDPDLYMPNQTMIAAPPPSPAPRAALYLNDGAGRFTDATAGSGLADSGYALGVCGADVDNAGDMDLYVTRFDGANALYRNDGGGRFTDIARSAGVEGIVGTDSSCAFADVDGDGWVDLYVAGYVDHTRENNIACLRKLKASGEKVR